MAPVSITSLLAGMEPRRIHDFLTHDVEQAAAWVRVTALDGVAEGQLCYGRMLLDGKGVPKDVDAAFKWFQRAAAQDNVDAINMVGRCFDMGWGTAEDPAAAAEHYRRAAASGHAWARYNIGHLYLDGRGVERSPARAYLYYLLAAEQGHVRAMNLVGRCCEEGWGRPRDPVEAASWYERSARGGYFRGQYNWATRLLEQGRLEEAAEWFERAATSGTPAVRDSVLEVSLVGAIVRSWGVCGRGCSRFDQQAGSEDLFPLLQLRHHLRRKNSAGAGLQTRLDQLSQALLALFFPVATDEIAHVLARIVVLAGAHALVDVRA